MRYSIIPSPVPDSFRFRRFIEDVYTGFTLNHQRAGYSPSPGAPMYGVLPTFDHLGDFHGKCCKYSRHEAYGNYIMLFDGWVVLSLVVLCTLSCFTIQQHRLPSITYPLPSSQQHSYQKFIKLWSLNT